MDSLTRGYVGWCLRHVLEAGFRVIRWANIDADAEQRQLLYNLAVSLPDRDLPLFGEEIDFLRKCGSLKVFPYDEMRGACKARGGYCKGFPYVEHGEKRVFFPKDVSIDEALFGYETMVNEEGILGTGNRRKSPHGYESEGFSVDAGSVLVDVGSAEGLFSLEKIETVSHAYLLECDRRWTVPLHETFSPWAEKVTICRRYVSNRTHGKEIRLSDVLKNVPEHVPLFVKMDIEGAERQVLEASLGFLKSRKVKLSCCTYHRQDDAEVLSRMLNSIGFRVFHSEGWMLPLINGIKYPYFRRGVLRAVNY